MGHKAVKWEHSMTAFRLEHGHGNWNLRFSQRWLCLLLSSGIRRQGRFFWNVGTRYQTATLRVQRRQRFSRGETVCFFLLYHMSLKGWGRKHSTGKVMADVFWDSEGILLVEFVQRGATVHPERYVQSVKKLEQRVRRVWPNSKMNQVFILPTVPVLHPPIYTFCSPGRWTPRTPFLRVTTSWNTACVKSSDVSAKIFKRLKQRWEKCADNEEDFVEK